MIFHPTIAWALDRHVDHDVIEWHERLPAELQPLVRVVVEDEDAVRRAVDEYNTVSFDEDIRDAGYEPDPNGARIRLIVVAYAMGDAGFDGWGGIESVIDELEDRVQAIEAHRVLIARPEEHTPEDRWLRVANIQRIPWLISSRGDDKKTIDGIHLSLYIDALLSFLALTDRSTEALSRPEVTSALGLASIERAETHVRVPGVLRQDVEKWLSSLVELTYRMVLAGCIRNISKETDLPKELPPAVKEALSELVAGATDRQEALAVLLGEKGLLSRGIDGLLHRGERYLRGAEQYVEYERDTVVSWSESRTETDGDGGLQQGSLLQRFVRWLAKLVGLEYREWSEEWGERVVEEKGVVVEVVEAVNQQISEALKLVGELRDRAEDLASESVSMPRNVEESLKAHLERELRQALRRIAGVSRQGPRDGKEVLEHAYWSAAPVVTKSLVQAYDEWEIADGRIRRAVQLLREPNDFRFAASMIAQTRLEVQHVLSSVHASAGATPGVGQGTYVSLDFATQLRPKFLALSEPVPVEKLSW